MKDPNNSKRDLVSFVMLALSALCGCIFIAALLSVFSYTLWRGLPHLSIEFFTHAPVPVGMSGGGMVHALEGSILVGGCACLIGILWGAGVGIFLAEYADTSAFFKLVRFAADIFYGIPSILVGILVYSIIVVNMETFSAIAGGIALGIVMTPIVARHTEGILRLIPGDMREAALALGIPQWKVVLFIIVPQSLRGLLVGFGLSLAVILGDPAPLFFTALNNNYRSWDLFQPIATLPMEIYRYGSAPFAFWHGHAEAGALTLTAIVVIVYLLAHAFLPGYRARR